MSRARLTVVMASLCALAWPAQSQTRDPMVPVSPAQPAVEQEIQLEDIVVNATPLEEMATRFVEQVARPAAGRGLARWGGPVCIGVMNFRSDAAQYIADRLVQNADDVGVPVMVDDCDPNIYIIGAVDAQALAAEWVSREPREFRVNVTGADASRSALDYFMTADTPVRWWHISIPMHFDAFTGNATPAVTFPGQAKPNVPVGTRTLQRLRIRDDLMRVVIIVDVERLASSSITQLADYLTVVAFAQIDPLASTREFPTILNLFDEPSTSPGLTEWDRNYLSALYEAVPDRQFSAPRQAESLARKLRQEPVLAGDAAPD